MAPGQVDGEPGAAFSLSRAAHLKAVSGGFYVGSEGRSLCPRVLLPLYLSYYLLRWREAGGPLASRYNF